MASESPPPAGGSPIDAGHSPDQTTLAGRYTLERELGRGGMAVVYQSHDAKHDRQVAIKVLHAEVSSLIGPDRFVREIQVAARLNHPGILPVYDSGESDSCLFYVMPYVEGESLRGRLDREGRIPVEEAVRIVRDVASALSYAHARGVVHRDVKPENILLHQGVPMLMDFGIAVAASATADTRLTRTGLLVGTPRYMSPEQAAGERELDASSDQYSLACVLYEMITGQAPHEGATAQALIARRLTEPVPDMNRLRERASPRIERALTRAFSAGPAARYDSVIAFAEALAERAARSPTERSLAVLPFLNLSADPENEYFADGITEDVIAQLSQIGDLKVISRTSVMAFKRREQGAREIAERLKVATLLDGSVRRAGDRVRIVAHLIDPRTDEHLWSETYDRELSDIFAIQTDVALQIAEALEAELTPRERNRLSRKPTENLEAYQLYLRGRHGLILLKGLEATRGYLEKAIGLDPGYAMAYATLALAYVEAGVGAMDSVLEPAEGFRLAREAATKALELDPGLAEAHTMLGLIKLSHDFDYVGAERELKRALEINPRSGDALDIYGRMLAGLERYDEALEMQERAHELDPLEHRLDRITTLLRAGRHDEALRPALELVESEPGFGHAHSTLGWTYILMGRPEDGLAALRHAASLFPENDMYRGQLGQALAMTGDVAGAEQVLRELRDLAERRYVSPYYMAYVYTGLGEHDSAMDCLEQAYDERGGLLYGIKGSFLFRDLRSHPRFQALLGRMNLA